MSPTEEKTVPPGASPRHACVLTIVHQPFDVRIFHKQARTLAAQGWKVTLIAPGAPDGETVDGVSFLSLPRRPRWRRPQNWGRMLRLALRTRADVYHLHDPELLIIGVLLRLLTRRPVIYDAHEVLESNVRLKEWLPAPLRPTLGRLARRAEHALARRLSAVICVTTPQAAVFSRVGPPVVLVANYPIAEHHGEPDPHREEPIVVFAGGLSPARGTDVLAEAFAQVRARVPESRLWLVGPAQPPAYEADLRQKIAHLGLDEAVKLFGRIPFPEVKELLLQAAVGITTYLPLGDYASSLPTKLFEYMACSLPCVCSNIPLWAEIVERAQCGLIVDPSDPGAVAGAIIRLLENREEAEEMGRRGREAFLREYTWEGEAPKLLALYQQLTGGDRPS